MAVLKSMYHAPSPAFTSVEVIGVSRGGGELLIDVCVLGPLRSVVISKEWKNGCPYMIPNDTLVSTFVFPISTPT